jgi:membrane protein insertase Oxa1/YidC/SpoIIIJ
MIAVFQLLRNQEMIRQSIPNFSPYFIGWDLTQSDPYYILPILAAGTTFLQQRMMITDPSQKMLMYIFPVMILAISVSLPAGLILYWFTNSLISIGNFKLLRSEKKPIAGLFSKLKAGKSAAEEEESAEEIKKKDTKDTKDTKEKETYNEESEIEDDEEQPEVAKKVNSREKTAKSGSNQSRQNQQKTKAAKTSVKGPKAKNIKGKKKGADNSK